MGMDISEKVSAKHTREPNTGCWLWTGSIASTGYGKFEHAGRTLLAHRASYEIHRGPIPNGLHIDHLCRVRCCVNPSHMEPVTIGTNVRRGLVTGNKWQKNTKLTQEQVDEIRALYSAGGILQRELGAKYGVTREAIGCVVRGRNWKPGTQGVS